MTTLNPHDAPLLRTDAEVLARIEALVGPAEVDRQLWIMLVDGDGRQLPVVMPITNMPPHPEPQLLTGLAQVLAGLRDELIASPDPGSALFTLERLGHDVPRPADLAWAEALGTACDRAEVPLRGVFLSTGSGVQRLR